MTINQDTVKSKWSEIKGDVRKAWGKLTDSEIENTKGDVKSLAMLVQQKYGEEREQFERKFSDIASHYETKKDTNYKEDTGTRMRN